MPLSTYVKLFCKSDNLVDIKRVQRHLLYLVVTDSLSPRVSE